MLKSGLPDIRLQSTDMAAKKRTGKPFAVSGRKTRFLQSGRSFRREHRMLGHA